MDEERENCCFDDWVGSWSKKTRKRPTAAAVTASLLDALQEAGIRDRSVLDVGCGIGDLAIETVARGASRALGVELSSKAVAEARRLAADRGVSERTSFMVGDGATTPLPKTDVVVLNRVFCCYPDIDMLLANSLSAAGSVYAFTAPPSGGLMGAIVRSQTRLANMWYRARPKKFGGFRVFIHDLERIDADIGAAGFLPVRRERRRMVWHMAVYARPERPAA